MKSLSDVIRNEFYKLQDELHVGNRNDFETAFELGVNYSEHWVEFSDENPEYYTPVILDTSKGPVIAWRAWSEQFGEVYTINGTDIVLSEKPKRWKPISYSECETI